MADETLPQGKVEFIEFHDPVLDAGDYTISVTQVVTTKSDKIKAGNQFTATHELSVRGERFSLAAPEIVSVFPPAGSAGDHSNVLPHLILKRSTLPWERPATKEETTLPWLALLVLDEADHYETEVVELGTLEAPATGWPGVTLESAQHATDKVTVLRIHRALLDRLLPTQADLAFLAHVRQGTDDNGQVEGPERAVIVGNRLPRKGALTTVHLVALEERFENHAFQHDGATAAQDITLVSLHSWRFSCPDDELYQFTPSALKKLGSEGGVPDDVVAGLSQMDRGAVHGKAAFLQLVEAAIGAQPTTLYRKAILRYGAYKKATFKDLLLEVDREPSTLRLATTGHAAADDYLSIGSTALPHGFRQGDRLMSWYRGPLVPAAIHATISVPAETADELLRYDDQIGMFDVSYAAAWELGRLIALKKKTLSIPLFNWKRSHAQRQRKAEDELFAHLPFGDGEGGGGLQLPDSLQDAFNRLSLLEGVPFNYLVPDERLLPDESLRFFQLDPKWIEALLDGAFSIGRVTSADHATDAANTNRPEHLGVVSGFLLRSSVVSGWPELQVDGYGDVIPFDHFVPGDERLPVLRLARLSPSVLICLFKGEVETVDVHLKPEGIHFGLDPSVDHEQVYEKELRNDKGEEQATLRIDQVPWRGAPTSRVVDVRKLADAIRAKLGNPAQFTSAQFALEMIEGVEKVRYRMREG